MKHKIVFLGDSSVGKTTIATRLISGDINQENNPTIGAAFHNKTVELNGLKYSFQIWDTAGEEKFKSMAPIYVQHASLAFIVFDLTKQETYDHVGDWYNISQSSDSIPVIILGNKSDLDERFYSQEQLIESCLSYQNTIQYIETSAYTGMGIEEAFNAAVSAVLDKKYEETSKEDHTTVHLTELDEGQRSGCC